MFGSSRLIRYASVNRPTVVSPLRVSSNTGSLLLSKSITSPLSYRHASSMSRKNKKSKATRQGIRNTANSNPPVQNTDDYNSNNSSQSINQIQKLSTCTTISTCEEYDLAKVVDQFYTQGLRSASVLLPGEMVHVKYPYSAGKVADVLVLSNGTIVSWGMTEGEVSDQLVSLLKTSELRSYKDTESEDMDFVEEGEEVGSDEFFTTNNNEMNDTTTNNNMTSTNISNNNNNNNANTEINDGNTSPISSEPSTMIGDVIYIRGSSPADRLLKKAAFSSGLARNTKLAALELSLEKFIASIKQISQRMATGGRLGFRNSQVLRITGQLLQIRGQLNLYSELIETPDHYWSEPELEALYTLISKKLDVVPRISILNKKLDYASELVGILKTHVSEQQSTRLEWMIIALIMIEVCFEIFHFMERYSFKQTEEFEYSQQNSGN